MRVHLIKKQTIEEFRKQHAQSRESFRLWLLILNSADWKTPEDILETFGSADLLGKGTARAVFDIGGNKFRMICHYVFGEQQVYLFICWIGTHDKYSILYKEGGQYTIRIY